MSDKIIIKNPDTLFTKRVGLTIMIERSEDLNQYIDNNTMRFFIDGNKIFLGGEDSVVIIEDLKPDMFEQADTRCFFMLYETVDGEINRCTACSIKKLL